MKRPFFLLVSALSLESLLGCGDTGFPQYSGKYELQSVAYSDPSFVGEKQMPSTLNLIDRMKYIGHHWDHQLQFEFIPDSEGQAAGIFTLGLDNLTMIDDGAWPNNWYDGVEVHEERKVYGSGAAGPCSYLYLYFAYLASIPPAEVLQKMYQDRGEYFGKDPVTKMDLYETLPHPEEAEFDDTEWIDLIEENEGLTVSVTFNRYRREQHPGGEDGYKNCILPPDPENRGKESVTFTYHASPEDLDDQTDIRKEGLAGMKESPPPVIFFRQVASDIK